MVKTRKSIYITVACLIVMLLMIKQVHSNSDQEAKTTQPTTLIITGGTIVTHDREFMGNLVIHDGKIVQIGSVDMDQVRKQYGEENVRVVDATGRYVMPGGIDPHVHLALPFSKWSHVNVKF